MKVNTQHYLTQMRSSRINKIQKDGFTPMESAIMLTVLKAERTRTIDPSLQALVEEIKQQKNLHK